MNTTAIEKNRHTFLVGAASILLFVLVIALLLYTLGLRDATSGRTPNTLVSNNKNNTSVQEYDMFSWYEKNEWHFAILPGKNNNRPYESITKTKGVIKGLNNVLIELDKLPKGSTIRWNPETFSQFTFPDAQMRKEITERIQNRGLSLQ